MKLTAQDFERLYEISAPWDIAFNADPLRFDGLFKEGYEPEVGQHVMFWFENYASCLLATQYLDQVKEDYTISHDEAMLQWTICTTYQASWANA
jgi:hypothetical protein